MGVLVTHAQKWMNILRKHKLTKLDMLWNEFYEHQQDKFSMNLDGYTQIGSAKKAVHRIKNLKN